MNPPVGPELKPCPAILVVPNPIMISGIALVPVMVPVMTAVELPVLVAVAASATQALGFGIPVKSTTSKPCVVVAAIVSVTVLLVPSELNPHQISPPVGNEKFETMRDQVTPPPVMLASCALPATAISAHRISPTAGFDGSVALTDVRNPNVDVACWLTEMLA